MTVGRSLLRTLLAWSLPLAFPAVAESTPITLADLATGAEFDSSDGALHFGGFSVSVSGSVISPLSGFQVVPLDGGFVLLGPLSAFDGESGGLDLSYTVTGRREMLEGLLSFNGAADGPGAEATVEVTVGALASLEVLAREGLLRLSDSVALGGTDLTASISTRARLTSGSGGASVISEITQRFAVVPEPASLPLLLLGAAGMLLAKRWRQ